MMDTLEVVGLLAVASHRRILAAVDGGPLSMTALSKRIGLSLSGTSSAAWRLRDAGLVCIKRRGRQHMVIARWRVLRLVGERVG